MLKCTGNLKMRKFNDKLVHGKHVGGSEEGAKRIHAKGYRQVVGSILWLARNSAPIVSYGASILSKCMQAPDQQA
jgi:hypothetical protein